MKILETEQEEKKKSHVKTSKNLFSLNLKRWWREIEEIISRKIREGGCEGEKNKQKGGEQRGEEINEYKRRVRVKQNGKRKQKSEEEKKKEETNEEIRKRKKEKMSVGLKHK